GPSCTTYWSSSSSLISREVQAGVSTALLPRRIVIPHPSAVGIVWTAISTTRSSVVLRPLSASRSSLISANCSATDRRCDDERSTGTLSALTLSPHHGSAPPSVGLT